MESWKRVNEKAKAESYAILDSWLEHLKKTEQRYSNLTGYTGEGRLTFTVQVQVQSSRELMRQASELVLLQAIDMLALASERRDRFLPVETSSNLERGLRCLGVALAFVWCVSWPPRQRVASAASHRYACFAE